MTKPSPLVRVTVVGFLALALAMGIGRFAFTPVFPMMRAEGLVDVMGGGMLASVHFIGYWLGAVFGAVLPWAPKSMFRVALAATALATLGMGLSESFPLWLWWRWLAGVCSAWTLMLVGNHAVRFLADHGRPDLQGWIFAGVGGDIALAGLACLGFMVAGLDSPAGWTVMGVASMIAALLIAAGVGVEMPATPRPRRQIADVRSPLDWRAVTAYGIVGMGYIIPATYLPLMARDIVPSPLVFGWCWPIFGAAACVSTLVVGRFYRRFTNRRIWAAAQLVMAAGLVLPAVQAEIWAIIIAGLSVGGTFMVVTMAGMKEAHLTAPPEDVMRHIAALTTAFATGQAVGPMFAGAVHDLAGGFGPALIATSAVLALSVGGLTGGRGRQTVRA